MHFTTTSCRQHPEAKASGSSSFSYVTSRNHLIRCLEFILLCVLAGPLLLGFAFSLSLVCALIL